MSTGVKSAELSLEIVLFLPGLGCARQGLQNTEKNASDK
jgi:hypothetical protein